jgi:hypothetical protein
LNDTDKVIVPARIIHPPPTTPKPIRMKIRVVEPPPREPVPVKLTIDRLSGIKQSILSLSPAERERLVLWVAQGMPAPPDSTRGKKGRKP